MQVIRIRTIIDIRTPNATTHHTLNISFLLHSLELLINVRTYKPTWHLGEPIPWSDWRFT